MLRAFDLIVTPPLGLMLLALVWLEHRRPLRRRTQGLIGRLVTNTAVTIPAMVIMRAALLPIVLGTATWVDTAGLGVTYVIPAPSVVRGLLAFVLMDYTTYVWHRLNHIV